MECRSKYYKEGLEYLQPLGETEFVTKIAEQSDQGGSNQAKIAGIVAHADLMRGEAVEEVLQAHDVAARGRFRGIRHYGARDENKDALSIPAYAMKGLYAHQAFRQGMRVLGRLGLTFDAWHYQHQNPEFAELAHAVPETTMILDHFGTPWE